MTRASSGDHRAWDDLVEQGRGLLAVTRPVQSQQRPRLPLAAHGHHRPALHAVGERAGALRAAIPAAPPAQAWPAGLTDREVEVLRLIAAGHSNRAIAQALFISPNTVLHHVSSIFAKLGVANRAAAAAYATRRGLAG